MINDNTILSSFDDRPTLLEWLKKVEDALKSDTATAVSVENPSANTYVFKITFADGNTLSSGNVIFPDSVKDVSIKNGHIIVTSVAGIVEDLGVLNPYADTIVVNAETNTTEIGGKLQVSGEAQVTGNVATGGNLGVTGQAVIGGGLSVGGKKINDSYAVSMSFTNEEIVSALDSDVTKVYTGDDVAQLDEFVEGQNGKILASLVTPVGTINITLYPCSFGGDVMYSFQGVMSIHTNFESIGGKRYSTLFVSLIKILNDPLEVHSTFSIRLVGIGA